MDEEIHESPYFTYLQAVERLINRYFMASGLTKGNSRVTLKPIQNMAIRHSHP